MIFDNITGITKGSYTGTAEKQVKRFCRYQGIMCEYATDMGYCKITGCAKSHELYGTYKTTDRSIGKWIKRDFLNQRPYYVCSLCGRNGNDYDNYCPNCGAKMLNIDYQGGDTE